MEATTSRQNISNCVKPHVRIIEQPAPRSLRFRYKSEHDNRYAGSIKGINSKAEARTYPSIQIVGYQGKAKVFVSCVTSKSPYRPHPHQLIGREECKYGVCSMEIPENTMMLSFTNLGIQRAKRHDIETELKIREKIGVDPFRTGFDHKNKPKSIDLTSLRLCFQVFLHDQTSGRFKIPLQPIVSDPIYNKQTTSDLLIVELSDCVSYVDGDNKKIILLCETISKDDIQVRFFEEKDGVVVWEDFGNFHPSNVHKQTAISFRPPRYHNLDVQNPVKVFIQLKRPSDGATSRPLPFEFLPTGAGKRKRSKIDLDLRNLQQLDLDNNFPWNPQDEILNATDTMEAEIRQFKLPDFKELASTSRGLASHNWNIPYIPNIVPEASLQSKSHHGLDDPASVNLRNLLDIDTHNAELVQVNLDSGELETFEHFLDVTNLSETLNTNLSLTDIRADQNMTDSFTRLANSAIESLCQETNSFK